MLTSRALTTSFKVPLSTDVKPREYTLLRTMQHNTMEFGTKFWQNRATKKNPLLGERTIRHFEAVGRWAYQSLVQDCGKVALSTEANLW